MVCAFSVDAFTGSRFGFCSLIEKVKYLKAIVIEIADKNKMAIRLKRKAPAGRINAVLRCCTDQLAVCIKKPDNPNGSSRAERRAASADCGIDWAIMGDRE